MDTNDSFIRCWFHGVNAFLEQGPREGVDAFLSECAKCCSGSYPLHVYREAFSGTGDLNTALSRLAEQFDHFGYELLPGRIRIMYDQCGCDLFREGLISSEKLCLCSEKSLLYIWEQLFGEGNVVVRRLSSLLSGGEKCVFDIQVVQLGHGID